PTPPALPRRRAAKSGDAKGEAGRRRSRGSIRSRRESRRPMHLFGLTGGIASGKSAVAARLRARGVPVLDADALAPEVVAPGTEGVAAVVQAFGPDVLTPSGELDRKRVADVVFRDATARAKLNAITHPRIGAL